MTEIAVAFKREGFMPRKRWLASAAGGALMLAVVSASAAGGPAVAGLHSSRSGALSTPVLPLNIHLVQVGAAAPTDAFCRASFDTPCYSPQEIRHALRRRQPAEQGR